MGCICEATTVAMGCHHEESGESSIEYSGRNWKAPPPIKNGIKKEVQPQEEIDEDNSHSMKRLRGQFCGLTPMSTTDLYAYQNQVNVNDVFKN